SKMKRNQGRRLQLSLAVCSLVGLMTAARPAHACHWYELCLDDVIPVVSACLVEGPAGCIVAKLVGDPVVGPTLLTANFIYKDALGTIAKIVYACSDTNFDGVSGACFPPPSGATTVGYYQDQSGTTGCTAQDFKCYPKLGCFCQKTSTMNGRYITTVENNQTDRLMTAVLNIDRDRRSDFTLGHVYAPQTYSLYDAVHTYVAYFIDGYSSITDVLYPISHGDHDADSVAIAALDPGVPRQSAPVIIWPHSASLSGYQLSGVIAHEVDHTRFGKHSADADHDVEEDGPYGTQVQWLSRVAREGTNGGVTVSDLDRAILWSSAVGTTNSRITSQDARNRLLQAMLPQAQPIIGRVRPTQPCFTGGNVYGGAQYRWAGFATSGSVSTHGTAMPSTATDCVFTGFLGPCSYWECEAPLSRNPYLTQYGGGVAQSSVDYGGDAARAVDGNTDGVWDHDSVTYTAWGDQG